MDLVERLRDHENEGVTGSDRFELRNEAADRIVVLEGAVKFVERENERLRAELADTAEKLASREAQLAELRVEDQPAFIRLRAELAAAVKAHMATIAERDRYHDALVARHVGEPIALLDELDQARAELAAIQSALSEEDGGAYVALMNNRTALADEIERLKSLLETANAYGAGENAARIADRELLAQMMIRQSLSTGHGDTVADLVKELEPQVDRLRAERDTFYMDYRMKCDEETKALHVELERLRAGSRAAYNVLQQLGTVLGLLPGDDLLKKCVPAAEQLSAEVAAVQLLAQDSIADADWLRAELSKHQESEFHPDWSMLEATRSSLREHQQMIRDLRAENAALRHVINMAARTLAGEGIEDQGEAYDKCARILDTALGEEKP